MENDNEEDPSEFDRNLGRLIVRRERTAALVLRELNPNHRLTVAQAREVLDALSANTAVTNLVFDLQFCPIATIHRFLEYVQSNPRLNTVTVRYDHRTFQDTEVLQKQYKDQMDHICLAVLHNPSIKRFALNILGHNPQAIIDLLSKTKTLELFDLDLATNVLDLPITTEMARAVCGGLARSSSIETFNMSIPEAADSLPAIILPGIGASKVKSISVSHQQPTANFYSTLSNLLFVAPSLKQCAVTKLNLQQAPIAGINQLFSTLAHPGCACLEKLRLDNVLVHSTVTPPLSDSASNQGANHNLQALYLDNIHFSIPKSVSLLWNFTGLKVLRVAYPFFDNDDDDQDYWKEIITRNPGLLKIYIVDDTWDDCATGILSGAFGHKSLETLEVEMTFDVIMDELVGGLFCRILVQTHTLQVLILRRITIAQEAAEQIVHGISANKSLRRVVFDRCSVQLPTIPQCLLFNQTLKEFDIGSYSIISNGNADLSTRTFCQSLSNAFQDNKVLERFCLPSMEIGVDNVGILVSGLSHSKTLKSIDFSFCTLDQDAFTCLEHALLDNASPNTLLVSSIALPLLDDVLKPFLRNLPRMPNIKEVICIDSLNPEEKRLLLQAIKDRKTLLSFLRRGVSLDDPLDVEIDFYLKLNRFGRQILDHPNASVSLWPVLLGRMTSDPTNVDALFYFIREYFPRQHVPIPAQSSQNQEQEPQRKRTRLA